MSDARKPSILVVDDNPQNIQYLGSILSEKGYDLAIAVDGQQALDYLLKNQPDLILLDVMMPEMDGYEVCRRIKKMTNARDIPIIFLTAKSEIDDLLQGFEAGGVDYVTKPFFSSELLLRIKTHIDLKLAKDEISILRGIIPICAKCKKVREDNGYWSGVESYIESRSKAEFSHGICPDCSDILYGEKDWYRKLKSKKAAAGDSKEDQSH